MSDLERLDDDLRELFAREKASYVEDVAARDAVLRRLQTAVLLAPMAVGGAAALSAAANAGAGVKTTGLAALGWKGAAVIGVVAFGLGVGVGEGHRALEKHEPASVASVASVAPAEAPSVAATEAPVVTPSSLPSMPTASVATALPVVASSTPSPVDVQAERALIDTARAALGRGLAADALAATEAHAKRFPRGRLAEEREALAVQALVAKGDVAAARARAVRFRSTFPDSIFRGVVEAAVEPSERK